MANTLTTSGKWTTAGNWSEGKPTAAQDCVIPTGKKVEITSASVCRSLTTEGKAEVAGGSSLTLGNSEKPNGPAGAGWCLSISTETTWTAKGPIKFVSSYTAEPLKLSTGGVALGGPGETNIIEGSGSGKYVIEGPSEFVPVLKVLAGKTLELKAKLRVTGQFFLGSAGEGATLILDSSTLEPGEYYEEPGSTVTAGTGTILVNDVALGIFEGKQSYYNVTLEGCRPRSSTPYTVTHTLAFNKTTENEGEKAVALKEGQTVTIAKGAGITSNGEVGNAAKVFGRKWTGSAKSTAPEARAKIALSEDIEVKGVIEWESIEATSTVEGKTFTIYSPEGSAPGGALGTANIKFEAKPEEGSSVKGKASGAIQLTGAAKGVAYTKLLGNEEEGGSTIGAVATKPTAQKFECAFSGKTAVIDAAVGSVTAPEVEFALMSDSAGEPGTVLSSGVLVGPVAGRVRVPVSPEVEVVAGSSYWLALLVPSGSFFVKTGAVLEAPRGAGTNAVTKISEETVWVVGSQAARVFRLLGTPSTVVRGKASGAVLLTGTAKGVVPSPVVGKATGAMLLTGTSKAETRAVVVGKASGAVLLTGTATGTTKAVVTAKATGTLLLGGTAKGQVAGAVFGKANGTLTLGGTAKGTLKAVVTGKATGPMLLTGTATGATKAVVTAKAAGAVLFTGAAKGSISGSVTGKASGAMLLTGFAHPGQQFLPHLAGRTSPSQDRGLTGPFQRRGVTTPTQRRGDA